MKEMAKYICNACEMGGGFEGNCANGNSYKTCGICNETAEALYKAGYRDGKALVKEVFSEVIKTVLTNNASDGYLTHHVHIPSLIGDLNTLALKYEASLSAGEKQSSSVSSIDLKAITFDIIQSLDGKGECPFETSGFFSVKRFGDGRERCVEVHKTRNGQKEEYAIQVFYEDGEIDYEYTERDPMALFRALVEISGRKEDK